MTKANRASLMRNMGSVEKLLLNTARELTVAGNANVGYSGQAGRDEMRELVNRIELNIREITALKHVIFKYTKDNVE